VLRFRRNGDPSLLFSIMCLSEDVFEAAKVTFKFLERTHKLRLPNGRRLRGVMIMGGLYIARDRKFYLWGSDGLASEVSDKLVWKQYSFFALVKSIKDQAKARQAYIDANPTSRLG
jgi:hypothetical protein